MIILQHLIFPRPGICTDEPLYFRRNERAFYAWSDDYITFERDGAAEFDTYFNGLSAEKLFRYTSVKKIFLKLKLNGVFRVTLMRKEKCAQLLTCEFVSETVVNSEGRLYEFSFAFDCKNTSGMYCFKILSLDGGSRFYGGDYCADIAEDALRSVKIGIDICTFRRERFVEKNIESLSSAFFSDVTSPLYGKLEIFISDNAKTLPQEMNTRFVHVFPSKNVGGAGGFTRGLMEIISGGNPRGITHVLIMDDDIVVEPESIYRTYVLLSALREEYRHAFIGGAMFRLDRQHIQVEAGALWNGGAVISRKSGLDLRTLDACLYNELEETVDYNAWWYSVVPIENVRADNLPLPVFIRGDDAEYGLRNTRKLILMNGICVWHEPFENKYSSGMFYYIFRNRLIDNAVRGVRYTKRQLLFELKEHVYNDLFCLRYKNVDLLLRGIEDFFRGPDWLKAQDGEKLHSLIMADGYKMQYIDELPFNFSYPAYEQMLRVPEDVGFRGGVKKLAIAFTFHGLFMSANAEKIVPTIGVVPRQLVRVKRSLNYDISSKKAFITEKSVKTAIKLYFRYLGVRRLIKRRYYTVKSEYRRRGGELMTLDFWNGYLGTDISAERPAERSAAKNRRKK